ncbi:MAG: ATP-binding cassette domain-containing protein [Candidatus ainarchaeum sp.]|nr:ATP-binding cassette domain-containing protein [Candidatus ainarchaeum sp.]
MKSANQADSGEDAIKTSGLTKRFNSTVTAVDSLNLEIKKGEVFGLLGPNGAGKTTLISMLCTLLHPTSGTATVAGLDIRSEPSKVRKEIGIVFQEPSVDDLLTGRENLDLHGMLYKMKPEDRKKRIAEMLALVELTDRADDLVRTYSGGMRRRLEIARGLMHRPKILFLDEPTLGLDPASREHIWAHIKRLSEEYGTTMVLTTHYMEEADRLCSRIGIIDKGKLVVIGTAGELKEKVGQDIVRLRGEVDLGKLRKLKFVKKAKMDKEGMVDVTMTNAAKNLQTLLDACGKLTSVQVREVTLNDVFLHYTGRDIHREEEEEGEGSWADRVMQWSGQRG